MNKIETINRMISVIDYFKNASWESVDSNQKRLPNSSFYITENELFNDNKAKLLKKLGDYVSMLPKYYSPCSKEKSVKHRTSTVKCRFYPINRTEHITQKTIMGNNEIPLVATDSNGDVISAMVEGGGFKKSYINSIVNYGPLTYSYTSIGRYGLPSLASCSLLLELPDKIKEIYSESYIVDIAKKYAAAGVHIVVSFYESKELSEYGYAIR